MDFYVYSRSAIEACRPHEVAHVIVSITSGPSDVARLRPGPACRGVLRLVFADAEAPSEQFPEAQLFSSEQAAQIWAFIQEHRAAVERIVVHCDAGKSRSPAVAAALSRVLTGDDADFFGGRYQPNRRVYRLLLAAAETRGREELAATLDAKRIPGRTT
jgi:predicted protein tyrosine phosphatase